MSEHNKARPPETVDEQSADLIKGPVILQDDQLSENASDDIDEPSIDIIAEEQCISGYKLFSYGNGYFEFRTDGVYYIYSNDRIQSKPSTESAFFICSPLEVIARTRDINSNSWGTLIKWNDADGVTHQESIPMESFHGNTSDYRKYLTNQGLIITSDTKHRPYLDILLQKHPIEKRALCVDKLGWHDNRYVLQSRSLGGNDDEIIVYQSNTNISKAPSQRGTLVQWRDEVCKPIAEQSRLVFSLCATFAGQLLEPLGYDGAGFHILGSSSIGKSITMCLAASIWDNPRRRVRTWRQTDNALESTASDHNDSTLLLDEISQIEPNIIEKTIYMLFNGEGKKRNSKFGICQNHLSWRIIFLSNGEQSIKKHAASESKGVNAGAEVRIAHIEADAGAGYGIFDSLIIADSAAAQADKIKELASQYYGTAGIAWLEHITVDKIETATKAKFLISNFMLEYDGLPSQQHRFSKTFALLAAAGEIATQAGITGWREGQATSAVKICLDNCLDNYGRDGEIEERQIIKQVQAFIEQHGASRFQSWHEHMNKKDHSIIEQRINNRVGFRRDDTDEYYFYSNMFESEVCSPFDIKKVTHVLDKIGMLNTNEPSRNTLKVSLPHSKGRTRVYAIKGRILSYEVTKSINNVYPMSHFQNNTGTVAKPLNTVTVPLSQLSLTKKVVRIKE